MTWIHGSRAWPPHSGHSERELEHRLTHLEHVTQVHEDQHENHEAAHGKLQARLALHERAILGILAVLQVLLQDKWPLLAQVIKGMKP